jgi:hypothetical protein
MVDRESIWRGMIGDWQDEWDLKRRGSYRTVNSHDTYRVAVDTIVEQKWRSLSCGEPVMAHLKLPHQEARKSLRLLNQEGINSATLFPGYQGVAHSLAEREYWDVPERATYWMKA